jgi:hypothetical protein
MNNRQANGRRRGRGGQQQQRSGGGSGQRDNGNRIDNRARGNAAQLLEKYKNLARDAQMQGDRVNTEYYLQFADHYFRVLSESRSRFEENNPGQQAPRVPRPDLEDEDYGMEGEAAREDGNAGEQQQERQSRDDRPREDRQRNGRANGNGNGHYRGEAQQQDEGFEPRPAREARDEEQPRRRGNNRPRREAADEAPMGLDLAVLPPAISAEPAAEEEKPKPRRGRPRRDADAPAA